MAYNDILYDKREAVATITINRPQVMNACTVKTYDEMIEALHDAEADDNVRVVVLTGAGRGFCAGDDVKEIFLNPEFRDAKPAQRTLECRHTRVALRSFGFRIQRRIRCGGRGIRSAGAALRRRLRPIIRPGRLCFNLA